MLKKLLIVLSAAMLKSMVSGAVDPSASFYIDHAQYITPGIYEFDIMAKASGSTTSFDLRTFQAGIYVNSSWVNGGTLTLSTAPGYSELTSPGYNGSYQWNSADKVINCSVNFNVKPSASTCISTPVDAVNPLRVARIRATNTVNFGCSTPDLKFNYVQNNSPLRLRTSFSWRETACTTNYELFYPGRTYGGVAKFNNETYTTSDADGRSTVNASANIGNCSPIVGVTAFIQGYYLGGSTMASVMTNQAVKSASYIQCDSVVLSLCSSGNPSNVVASVAGVLMFDGSGSFTFPSGVAGSSYYLMLTNRNGIKVFSTNPVSISSGYTQYNFTQASAVAGDNQKMVDPGVYAIYSGDLNQDDFVDLFDYPTLDDANYNFLSGVYTAADLNGDGFADLFDYPILDENNYNFVSAVYP